MIPKEEICPLQMAMDGNDLEAEKEGYWATQSRKV
jgi:hypothetical protein